MTFYVIKWTDYKRSFVGSCTYKTIEEAKKNAEGMKNDYKYEIVECNIK